MGAHTAKSSASAQQHESPFPNVEDQIRRRAYELYEQRGREDGHDVEDWLLAEEEVTQKRSHRIAA